MDYQFGLHSMVLTAFQPKQQNNDDDDDDPDAYDLGGDKSGKFKKKV